VGARDGAAVGDNVVCVGSAVGSVVGDEVVALLKNVTQFLCIPNTSYAHPDIYS